MEKRCPYYAALTHILHFEFVKYSRLGEKAKNFFYRISPLSLSLPPGNERVIFYSISRFMYFIYLYVI